MGRAQSDVASVAEALIGVAQVERAPTRAGAVRVAAMVEAPAHAAQMGAAQAEQGGEAEEWRGVEQWGVEEEQQRAEAAEEEQRRVEEADKERRRVEEAEEAQERRAEVVQEQQVEEP